MSVVGVHRLVRDLERRAGAVDRLREDPETMLSDYPLSGVERSAVLSLDATALVDLGVNPLVMRTLLVLSGVPNSDIYTHNSPLRG